MLVVDQVKEFKISYDAELQTLNDQFEATSQRLEDLTLEERFIQEQELVKAIEKRVLSGDMTEEKALRRKLEKIQSEKLTLAEEVTVLGAVIPRFKQEKFEAIKELTRLFQEEKRMVEDTAYKRMMKDKKVYEESIIKEAESLHQYRKADVDLQLIEYEAGQRQSIFSDLVVRSAAIETDAYRFGGVYLPLEMKDIIRLIKNC
ncbi:hypothetical protein [Peribacillus simplex]|uniref:Uncharacterized protein n=1 Tax=Peribacillus simplex TaxID=1478 RepID=A0AAN2PCF5_9BACI|nr:hypothetical protein [Peribacillus simplex]CEG30037.1 hypothetical protein BN1180_00132 [Peribacillus simplex]